MKLTQRFVSFFAGRLALAAVAICCSAAVHADPADPPGRVGRLGEMNGQVWLYTPDAGEWVTAERNRPLTTGDRLSTDTSGRAEVHIGSTTVRLDTGTELEVLGIDDDHIALQLHNGSVATRLRSAESAREFELRTAEGRFTTPRPGRYRFDRTDEASHVTVWSGEAVYEGPGSALTVNAGQRAEFWMERDAAQYSITEPVRDAFASWSADHDRRDERSAATRYVSPEMTGVEDLDRYGRWEQAPEYGTVWIPRAVPQGWAPYGAGHWAWVSPWGWTWVDDMPWGFAPFHYGRWAYFNNNWCWVPGAYVRRPVYAPALVGWIGGPHLSVSIAVGERRAPHVGWFPLAPREVYVPSYRVTPRYVQQVNVTHVTNITNITTIVNNPQNAVTNVDYRNRRFPHAVTVVTQDVMVNRRPVGPMAAQLRDTPDVLRLANQPSQRVMLSAPQVATPAMTPAVTEARRMRRHDDDGGRASVVAASPVVVPPSPLRATNGDARAAIDPRQGDADRRRRDMREGSRPDAVAAVPQRAAVIAPPTPVAPAAAVVPARPAMPPVKPTPAQVRIATPPQPMPESGDRRDRVHAMPHVVRPANAPPAQPPAAPQQPVGVPARPQQAEQRVAPAVPQRRAEAQAGDVQARGDGRGDGRGEGGREGREGRGEGRQHHGRGEGQGRDRSN